MAGSHYVDHDSTEHRRLVDFNGLVGLYLWSGLASITAIVTTAHWVRYLEGYYRRRRAGFRDASSRIRRASALDLHLDESGNRIDVDHTGGHSWNWHYTLYFLEAAWRKYSVTHFRVTKYLFLGSVGQLLLIGVYLGLNIGLLFGGTSGDVNWIAHHAAKLCYANLPLVIGLAGKNNVLSWFTGFAYESLNVLHRWSARFLILLSAVHIGGRIWVNEPRTKVGPSGSGYVIWGWVAFTLLVYMVLMASRIARNRAYQFFLIQHVLLWFAIVPCLIIHRPRSQGWVWAGLGLHMLDRIGRTGRILFYHLVWPVPVDRSEGDVDEQDLAWVTVLAEDTMRVTVRTRQNWIAGQHVYLHCYSESPGGHPFTISTASRSLTQADNQRPRLAEQELIIRVREGMTRRIFDLGNSTAKDVKEASGQATYPKASVPIRAWTEGPYGHQKYLGEDYNTLLLIAGGSGVSYTLSIALDLVRRARAMHLGSPDKSVNIATKRLSFVWVIKREEQIAWIDDHLDAMCTAAPLGFLHVAIYVTSMKRRALGNNEYPPGHEAVDGASNEGTPRKGGYALKAVKHTQVEVLPGRPDFDGIIQTEIQQSDRSDWFGVGTCGPTPMLDSIAIAVQKATQPSLVFGGDLRRNIYLTAEEFGW